MIDNIFVVFGDQVFQQLVGISLGTNCAPLLADLFNIHMKQLKANCARKNKTLAVIFNWTFRYIDNVFPLTTVTSFLILTQYIPVR